MTCHATQQSDEMHCAKCRLRWDVNDQDRPACAPRTASGVPAIKSPPLVPTLGRDRITGPAARNATERLPFVSALAPDTLHHPNRKD